MVWKPKFCLFCFLPHQSWRFCRESWVDARAGKPKLRAVPFSRTPISFAALAGLEMNGHLFQLLGESTVPMDLYWQQLTYIKRHGMQSRMVLECGMNAALGLLALTSLLLYVHAFITGTRWTTGLLHLGWCQCLAVHWLCRTQECMHSATHQHDLQGSHCPNGSPHPYLK